MANILIVDDDPTILAIGAELLRSTDHAALLARDGEEAIKTMSAVPIDLVVLDMFMPNMDGLETIMQMRRLFPAIRIVAITSGGSMGPKDMLQIARTLGADATLQKPLRAATFVETISEVLNSPPHLLHPRRFGEVADY